MRIGAIEAGGTKFVCAIGSQDGEILERITFPTTTPDETLNQVGVFFREHKVERLGVGAFGPINLRAVSEHYGTIGKTPKLAWRDFPLLQDLKSRLKIPVFIDTDVNVASLGEYNYGVAKDAGSCLYITVGTGIGAGFVQNGIIFQGYDHSEMGHILIQKHPEDSFEGACPSHNTCLEGLAAGPAIETRYGKKSTNLADQDDVWELEAYYLAQAIMNYFVILSPEKIIIGGGVMKQEKLYPMIRKQFINLLNDYIEVKDVNQLIVAPALNDNQGVKGAIALAMQE
ncbi:ROK family protein [Oceanobacillus kimchii]|uniref:ROK family protein n=1 Tax=Oceanobacillus kimchii TaxID=746691 RepID=UPI0021A88A79|nr:ROK family protein [Oceanobacillus kimchii]MCT1578262.1 ROK family protein [Oceanobacillus kimchii]MCT2134440.1 ROK family protein [Oceanobacillus kimchii]